MNDFLKLHLLPVTAYPGVLLTGLSLQYFMLQMDISLQISSFIPIIVGVMLITLLEHLIPYRKQWKPNYNEVCTDVIFTLVIQIALPRVLGFLVVISVLEYVQENDLHLLAIWPHHWHLATQVMLMVVSAEFMRYWLHRASHTWSPLWRLHAVHHSPDKLYWVNTGRFHPIEKSIQFLFDSFPFILLGVNAEVLAIYFVFYALNGFFQHSNINLKMGLLNYLISSAQLHRWHHSKIIEESGNNYGNNLIIWDLVFGSWFLPKDKQVDELGLFNRSYPTSFIAQMKAPFTPGIDKFQTTMLGLNDIYLNIQTHAGLLLTYVLYKIPFELALSSPMKYQRALLRKIIRSNKDTEYGRLKNFGKINNHEDFVTHIPIQDYEVFRDYIERQEKTHEPCLTQEQPAYYAVTSGTTGKPKYIPVLAITKKQHQRALAIFASIQSKTWRYVFGGKLLAIPGAYHEGEMEGGSIYGSISGLLYFSMPRYLQQKYVIPSEVFGLHDHELKYRLIIRLAIQHANITYMVSANPSTFLKLSQIINSDISSFADDIEAGSFSGMSELPANVADAVSGLLLMNKQRADTLRQLHKAQSTIRYSDLWPNLKLIVTWTGGSCGITINSLKPMLPEKTGILELGYLASELRGTITLEGTGNSGALTFRDYYFEFIEVNTYAQGLRETLLLDQLEVDRQYYVIITTPAGLYRYFMNDIIEVTAYRSKTPLIRFVQKGKGVTNITGEKLTEQQLITAVEAVNTEIHITMSFYIALAKVNDSRYELYLEPDTNTHMHADIYAALIDSKLQSLNTEYHSKRSSGRLNALVAKCLRPGAGADYKAHCIAKGQRESQFKYMLLQNQGDCDYPLDDHLL